MVNDGEILRWTAETSKQFLLKYSQSAYTTCRSVNKRSIFDLEGCTKVLMEARTGFSR